MEHTKHIFLSVTQRVFSNWTALRLAVEHDMGSVEDAKYFCNAVTEMVYSWKSTCDMGSTLGEYLDDYMYEKFSTELEDESQYEVANELEKFFRYLKDGEMVKAEQEFDKLPPMQSWIYTDRPMNALCESMPVENNSNTIEEQDMSKDEKDEESNMDAEDDTVDKNKDTDGWTLVTNKRNK